MFLPSLRELLALEQSVPTKKQDLLHAQSELKVVGERWEKLSHQVRGCRSQLEEARSGLQAHRSRGQVLEALMEQKTSGAIPGIHGRLVSSVSLGLGVPGWPPPSPTYFLWGRRFCLIFPRMLLKDWLCILQFPLPKPTCG